MRTKDHKADRAILAWIQDYVIQHGYSPALREIADGLGLASTGGMYPRLMRLRNEGHLTWEDNQARTIRVTVPKGSAEVGD